LVPDTSSACFAFVGLKGQPTISPREPCNELNILSALRHVLSVSADL